MSLTVSDADPFGPAILGDPLGFHADLRAAGPVVYLSRYDAFALGRYEQVRTALVDWQRLQSGAGVGLSNFNLEPPWRPPSLLLESDPPRHDAPRAVLEAILTPRALRSLHDQWFADAERLLDDLIGTAEFDAMTAIAEAFPLRVFPDAVGIGQEGRENLLPYGDHLFNAFGPANDLVARGADNIAGLAGWVDQQCQREALAPGGFGAQVWQAADRSDIAHEQAPLVVRSLLSAGVDTTVHGIGATLFAVAAQPGVWQQLREQPQLASVAFEEAIRWESPVQTFFRTTTAPVDIDGVAVEAGRKVLMFLGSANRDPRRWPRADEFDLTRDPSGHVGFGMGLHQCVGQHVARLEGQAVLQAMLRRISDIELVGEPRRHLNNTMRAWKSLPVRVSWS